MTRNNLLKEKEILELKLKYVNEILDSKEESRLVIDYSPWEKDLLWQVADIIRISPIINKNYPHGYDCEICNKCGNECTTDGDGCDCNWAFMNYFERELTKRKYYGDTQ